MAHTPTGMLLGTPDVSAGCGTVWMLQASEMLGSPLQPGSYPFLFGMEHSQNAGNGSV